MTIEMTFSGARVDGTLEGKPFSVVRKGGATSLEGIRTDGNSFGGMVGSELLRFCDKVLDGANIVIDETDDLNVWATLPEDVADEVYEALC